MKDWKTSVAGIVLACALYINTSPDFEGWQYKRWAGAAAAAAAAALGIASPDRKTPKP